MEMKDVEMEYSATEKYQDLLNVTRKLVVPCKYKRLMNAANYLDHALNFLKSRQGNDDQSHFIMLKDIQKSIMHMHGKSFTVSQFRQLMTLADDHYDHKWSFVPRISQHEPQLMINFHS